MCQKSMTFFGDINLISFSNFNYFDTNIFILLLDMITLNECELSVIPFKSEKKQPDKREMKKNTI